MVAFDDLLFGADESPFGGVVPVGGIFVHHGKGCSIEGTSGAGLEAEVADEIVSAYQATRAFSFKWTVA